MAWTSPRTWVAGETVTASLLNTHLRDNLLETAPAKVTAAGDIVYATGANALARLAKGSAYQVLRMNSGATAPEWANPPHLYVPLAYTRHNNTGTYSALTQGYFSFNSADFPAGYTVYFVIVWSAGDGAGGTNQAKVALRNITDSTDTWSSTLTTPVSERRDRNAVTLTSGKNYQVWAQSEQSGQQCYVNESYLEFTW